MKQKRQQTGGHSPEEDWAQRLRDHLAGYEAPVPDDLWEKIEARLPKEMVSPMPTKKKKKARIVPLWARWAAVAAVFVGGMILWNVALDPRSLATEGTQEGGMWRSAE
jgi:type VI protein secretion system component VasF